MSVRRNDELSLRLAMLAAADEIDRLTARVEELEALCAGLAFVALVQRALSEGINRGGT
jgi:hypothetical protein